MTSTTVSRDNRGWKIDLPDKCPICHHLVVITGVQVQVVLEGVAEVVLFCPNPDCQHLFMGFYKLNNIGGSQLIKIIPHRPTPEETPEIIRQVSPNFIEIYTQAKEAKDSGLMQICGPGYRKAFEYLIKDYAKQKAADDETRQKIEKTFAGTVVENYISDGRIQSVAKRALWLGNDETHYLRVWTDHDIEDLIALIRLTIHWIEIEQLSNKYMESMPDS